MKKPLLFTVLVVLISLSFVYAVPMIPTVFNGTVTYSGGAIDLQGYDINFTVGTKPMEKIGTVGSGNSFEVDVDPEGAGTLIHFYIGGVEALETGSYVRGGFVFLDLTIDSLPTQDIDPPEPDPYCGDGSCNNGETCSTCSQDCGSCDDGDDDNGGGGGGGSSSSSQTIILQPAESDDDNQITDPSTTPITGSIVNEQEGFSDFLNSGGIVILLAGLIILLGIILILIPSRKK